MWDEEGRALVALFRHTDRAMACGDLRRLERSLERHSLTDKRPIVVKRSLSATESSVGTTESATGDGPADGRLPVPILFVNSNTKLYIDYHFRPPYDFRPGKRIGGMFRRVDGSMATAERVRPTGGRAASVRQGMPASSAARRCRKHQPKRSAGNTGNTGNSLPKSGVFCSSTISGDSLWPPPAALRRMVPQKPAETGGNPWMSPQARRHRGMEGRAAVRQTTALTALTALTPWTDRCAASDRLCCECWQ